MEDKKNKNQEAETKQYKSFMILALKIESGVVKAASKLTGISTSTHYRWEKEDDIYRDSVNRIKKEQC